MSALQFRNVNTTPDDPVEKWGVEGILAAIDRGSLPHWRRVAAAVCADPWGSAAGSQAREDIGVAATLQRILGHARDDVDAAARAEVRRRLQDIVEEPGLTAAQFAQRIGTSASRMSTYLSGMVVPSAALLVRCEVVSKRAAQSHAQKLERGG